MQFKITALDIRAGAMVVACPHCKAQPGQACDFKVSKAWDYHLRRVDKAQRARMKDLYGCRRCEYACDCSPRAARWLPTITITEVQPQEAEPREPIYNNRSRRP